MDVVDLFKDWTPGMVSCLVQLSKDYRQGREYKEAVSKGVRGYWKNLSPEGYDNRCKINSGRWNKGNERELASGRTKKQWAGYSEERRREVLDKVFLNEEYRRTFAEARANMTEEETKAWVDRSFHNPHARKLALEGMPEGLRRWWAGLSDEQKKEELGKRIHSNEAREASNEGLRRRWKSLSEEEKIEHLKGSFWNPEVLSRRGNTQTWPEHIVELWLEKYYPGEWKYNGASKEVIIGGRAPDFINVDGKKEVIEVFGIYWHPESDVEQRINHYRKYGFDCKVIWEYECSPKDIERILVGGQG